MLSKEELKKDRGKLLDCFTYHPAKGLGPGIYNEVYEGEF